MTHERYAESVGSYLLGALPEVERQAFERHLEGCARCREEVDRLRVAAEALPHGVEPLAPPPGLKASLMEVVEREAAQRSAAAAEPARLPARRSRFAGLSLPRLRPATAALGGAALLAIGVGVGYVVSDDGAGGARTVAGTVSGLPTASASLTVAPDGDQAVLRVRGMPATAPDTTYQVWLSRDGRVTSQSLFTVGRDGQGAAAVRDPVDGADAVMVTREPAGGSPAPTAQPIVTVKL
jgi:anti-sigma-K factor RskA